jgi:hypothetical protein
MQKSTLFGLILSASLVFAPIAAHAQTAPRQPSNTPPQTIAQFYGLTPKQKQQITAFNKAADVQVKAIKANNSLSIKVKAHKIGQILTALDNQELAILTPAQRKKHTQVKTMQESSNYLSLSNEQKIAGILISEKYSALLMATARNRKLSIDVRAQKLYALLKQRNAEVAQYYTPAQRAKSKAAEAKMPSQTIISQIKAQLQQQDSGQNQPKR